MRFPPTATHRASASHDVQTLRCVEGSGPSKHPTTNSFLWPARNLLDERLPGLLAEEFEQPRGHLQPIGRVDRFSARGVRRRFGLLVGAFGRSSSDRRRPA